MFKKLIPILTVIILCLGVLLPLFHTGFFTMHDDEQIARLFDLDQTIKAGNIPPRLAPNLGFGYGYPFFNFYPSFAYYVGEVFHVMGFGYIVSTKLMLATGFLLSALFIYIFAKEFFGKLAGIVAAVAYTYASYHAVDVYVRGAFAEAFAFVFLPLIFWTIYKLSKKQTWLFVTLLSLSIAGLILSHNLIAFMSAPFIGVWFLYAFLLSANRKRFVTFFTIAFLLGLGLSSFFWLPSYMEKDYTLVNILTSELANYSLHFVCVHQLWESPVGYGGSIPGCYDGISFEVGKIQIFASVVAVLLSLYFLVKKKLDQKVQVTLLFGGLFLLSIFLTVKFSKPIWDSLSPLWYVQFPWRYLLISAFLSAVLCASVVGFVRNNTIKIVTSVLIAVLIIGLSISRFTPERFFNATDQSYTNTEKIRWETSSLAYEYVPRGIKTTMSEIGTTKIDITKGEIATQAATVLSGSMNIQTVKNLPQDKKFQVTVVTSGVLQINTYSFPGWRVFVNGKETKYEDNNKLKLIQIPLDKGSYSVEAKFLDTPIRSIGNTLSVISIIVIVGVSVGRIARKKK